MDHFAQQYHHARNLHAVEDVLKCYQDMAVKSLSGPPQLNLYSPTGRPGPEGIHPTYGMLPHKKPLHLDPSPLLKPHFPVHPSQPSPRNPVFIMKDNSPSIREETILEGEVIACFRVGGEKRLCLPQIFNTVLRNFTWEKINERCDALHIFCSRCTEEQLQNLKDTHVLPSSVLSCGLITKTDAERLCHVLLHSQPERYNNNNSQHNSFLVYHECFGKCKGLLNPDTYMHVEAKCICCNECEGMFTPQNFVCHSHKDQETTTCHWGFDSANWRHYILVDLGQDNIDQLQEALKAIKNKFDDQRKMKEACRSSPDRDVVGSTRLTDVGGEENDGDIDSDDDDGDDDDASKRRRRGSIDYPHHAAPHPRQAHQHPPPLHLGPPPAHTPTSTNSGSTSSTSAFRPWSPQGGVGDSRSPIADLKRLASLSQQLQSGPPKLLNPERVVPQSEEHRYERTFAPNVSLAPRPRNLSLSPSRSSAGSNSNPSLYIKQEQDTATAATSTDDVQLVRCRSPRNSVPASRSRSRSPGGYRSHSPPLASSYGGRSHSPGFGADIRSRGRSHSYSTGVGAYRPHHREALALGLSIKNETGAATAIKPDTDDATPRNYTAAHLSKSSGTYPYSSSASQSRSGASTVTSASAIGSSGAASATGRSLLASVVLPSDWNLDTDQDTQLALLHRALDRRGITTGDRASIVESFIATQRNIRTLIDRMHRHTQILTQELGNLKLYNDTKDRQTTDLRYTYNQQLEKLHATIAHQQQRILTLQQQHNTAHQQQVARDQSCCSCNREVQALRKQVKHLEAEVAEMLERDNQYAAYAAKRERANTAPSAACVPHGGAANTAAGGALSLHHRRVAPPKPTRGSSSDSCCGTDRGATGATVATTGHSPTSRNNRSPPAQRRRIASRGGDDDDDGVQCDGDEDMKVDVVDGNGSGGEVSSGDISVGSESGACVAARRDRNNSNNSNHSTTTHAAALRPRGGGGSGVERMSDDGGERQHQQDDQDSGHGRSVSECSSAATTPPATGTAPPATSRTNSTDHPANDDPANDDPTDGLRTTVTNGGGANSDLDTGVDLTKKHHVNVKANT